jgi:hypothetical protein
MRNYVIVFLFLVLLVPKSSAQKPIKAVNPLRVEEFYNLNEPINQPFLRRTHELPRILIESFQKGEIKGYVREGNGFVAMSYDDIFAKIGTYLYTLGDDFFALEEKEQFIPASYYDFYKISLDVTIQETKKVSYRQINYINLYWDKEYSQKEFDYYTVSFAWSDVKQLLDRKKEIWYPLDYDIYFRPNILVGSHQGMSELSSIYTLFDKAALQNIPESGHELILKLKEQKKGDIYIPIEHEYYFQAWNESFGSFQKLGSLSNSNFNSNFTISQKMMLMSDAIEAGMLIAFQEADELVRTITENPVEMLLKNDMLTPPALPTDLKGRSFSSLQSETLLLNFPMNKRLHEPGRELGRILFEAVANGKIVPYGQGECCLKELYPVTDYFLSGLINIMSLQYMEDPNDGWGEIKEVPIDEIVLDVKKNGLTPEKEQYFHSPEIFTHFQVIYEISFERDGNNKKYKFSGLIFFLPDPEMNINKPVGIFKAADLANVLRNDLRAVVWENGKTVNFMDVFENRWFDGYFSHGDPIEMK